MITCEHCGSPLPEGAIFCGECGRAVSAASARRQAPPAATRQDAPPPLQSPDPHGRPRQDPASEAWLPEATLDPATRAWLAGRDRGATGPVSPVPTSRSGDTSLEPRSAPSHVHGSESGLGSWAGNGATASSVPPTSSVPPAAQDDDRSRSNTSGAAPSAGPAQPVEPSLDPDAFPSEPAPMPLADSFDAPSQRQSARTTSPGQQQPAAWTQYAEPVRPPEPAAPTWWVGRSRSDAAETAADVPGAAGPDAAGSGGQGAPTQGAASAAPAASAPGTPTAVPPETGAVDRPSAGDTNVVEPLPDRRAPRRASLVQPGAHASVCHVCGHQLEPDDIFCPECGAVRGAVTAAFTGPIVPLPVERPDWAAAPHDDAGGDGASSDPDSDGDAGPDSDSRSESGADAEPDAVGADGHEGADWAGLDGGGGDGTGDLGEPEDLRGPAAGSMHDDDSPRPLVEPIADTRSDAGGTDTGVRGSASAHRPDDGPVRTDTGAMPPAPGSPTVPSSAPRGRHGVPIGPGPFVAPLPPVTGAVAALPADPVPSSADADEDAGLDEDVEVTRIVGQRTQQAPFVLHFSTGERVDVHGTGLLGRLPRPSVGEDFDAFVTILDPGKSVSKTHLEFGRDGDDLWVSDRFSGNGTTVRHIDGSIRSCEPGRRYRVERGARVDIGEQFFLVQ